MKKALITGISGQDGANLTKYLLSLGYEVHGIVRRSSLPENETNRLEELGVADGVTLHYGDLLDWSSLAEIVQKVQPDEVYHLAAQSHVGISSKNPTYTIQANCVGTVNVFEACRVCAKEARIYFAASSEMFGNNVNQDGFQSETTTMEPVSPYGCSKLFGYNLARHYRSAYDMFIACGILFNHESPMRSSNFVTAKVVKGAVEIFLGVRSSIELGNLYACRDWGDSRDYCRAMHMMLLHTQPDDFVVATGVTRSIKDLCETVFNGLDLDWKNYVKVNAEFFRPQELTMLKGDSSKIQRVLGWKPQITFGQMIGDMTKYWNDKVKKGL